MNIVSLLFGPFRVAVYTVTLSRGRKDYPVDIILSPRVIRGAAGIGHDQSHSSRLFLMHQLQDSLGQVYGDELAKLHLSALDYRHVTVVKSRNASLREHLRYLFQTHASLVVLGSESQDT